MHHQMIRAPLLVAALALPLLAVRASASDPPSLSPDVRGAMAQTASPEVILDYRRRLKEYLEARDAFEQEAGVYWSDISAKRKGRNAKRRAHQEITLDDYVLVQPPVYSGPKRPVNPAPEIEPEPPRRERKHIPVVGDLLKAAQLGLCDLCGNSPRTMTKLVRIVKVLPFAVADHGGIY